MNNVGNYVGFRTSNIAMLVLAFCYETTNFSETQVVVECAESQEQYS